MAHVGYHDRSTSPSDEEDYHSAGSSPPKTPPPTSSQLWKHDKDIGQGGFGVVKLYVHQRTGAKIVLKACKHFSLSREAFERWTIEREILKRLDHENIVRAHDIPEGLHYASGGNVPCICMEYCDGGDLRQVLSNPSNCCGLSEEQIRQIFQDVNNGIRFLHSERVIHRDLKPENILLKKINNNKVVYKLTDFGYAKSYDQSSVCTSLVGTMQYVAPEVIKGQQYNSSVDFWSFAIVVFECITGIRPFLHGPSSATFAWIDPVAKKGNNVIYIHWAEDGETPVYSEVLPKPHSLSKPFEDHITSWLRTTLHYNPEMRGGRLHTVEDAPCLNYMQQILSTKIVNVVCTTIGEVYAYKVEDTTTIADLKKNISCSTTVEPIDQYLIRPDGTLPLDSDLVTASIPPSNVGYLFVFTTSLLPSFKVMHSTNSAVSSLTAYGDENIDPVDRKRVFSIVYFNIREKYTFFLRLHQAHGAILRQIRRQCIIIREKEMALFRLLAAADAVISMMRDSVTSDHQHIQNLHPETLSDLSISWNGIDSQLLDQEAELKQLTKEVEGKKQESETYLRLADELMAANQENNRLFDQYQNTCVIRAKNILNDIKTNNGRQLSQNGRMQEVLLEAMKQAQSIIENKLNGVSFCQGYVVLGHAIQAAEHYKEKVEALRGCTTMLNKQRTERLWEFVEQPLLSIPREENTSVMSPYERQASDKWSQNKSSTGPLSINRQMSSTSVSSVESVSDPAMVQRISQIQRTFSQDDTQQVLCKNKQLMEKLSSLTSESPPPPIRAEVGL